ncbi:hypothetical protein G7Z17_g7513 [Cylindrodendrum hubeiense]|uniref:Uncharacterized protein n=1 Tax=Cylindrodendrum hubeiense TaxID=595255 RepID=A0A9P5H7S9_9HYPO|nr:hypothetical protein G7Z17_g7513 [Cylindrodendrum hubeiense]
MSVNDLTDPPAISPKSRQPLCSYAAGSHFMNEHIDGNIRPNVDAPPPIACHGRSLDLVWILGRICKPFSATFSEGTPARILRGSASLPSKDMADNRRGIKCVHSALSCNRSHDAAGQPPRNCNAMTTTTPQKTAADDKARQVSRRTVSSVLCPTSSRPKGRR